MADEPVTAEPDAIYRGSMHLFTSAFGFLHAARAVNVESADYIENYFPVVLVNLNYSLELSLKAFILLKGRNLDEPKTFGHHLDKLYNRAIELGYDPPVALGQLVSIVGPGHADHTTRYPTGEPMNRPDLTAAILIARDNIDRIGKQLPVA
jgi:hypothetical protein